MRARLASSLMLMVALALPALAQDRRGGPSLDRVLPHVRQSVPGTFYDAEGPFFGPDGRATYRIKWMTPDNRIIWFNVDAQSGHVLGGAPAGPPPPRYREDGPRWQDNKGWGGRGDWGNGNQGGWGNGNQGGGRGGWGNGNQGGGQGGWGNGNQGGNQGGGQGGWGGRGGPGGGPGGGGWGRGGQGSGQGGGHGGGDRGGDRGGGHHRPNGG